MFYRKDPRRVQPLVDYLVEEFHSVNFNSESTLEIIKVLCYFRALYEQLGWKFSAWTDEVLRTYWPHIASEHDEVSIVCKLLCLEIDFTSTGRSLYQ